METQVNQLKLNVTNIKSYLISSNKKLKKLRGDKKNLFFKLNKKKQLREEENRLESRNLGVGSSFSRITSAVTSPERGIFDKILDFFGLIALGILVQKLPQIIAKINEFFNSDFYKTMKFVVSGIVKGAVFLVDIASTLTAANMQRLKDEKKYYDDSLDKINNDLDSAKNFFANMFGSNSMPMPMSPSGGMFQPPTFPIPYPSSGLPIPPPQTFSQGGTVEKGEDGQQAKPSYTPRKSGPLKMAERDMTSGFENFALSVDAIKKTIEKEEENAIALAEMSKQFSQLTSLEGGKKKPKDPKDPYPREPRTLQPPSEEPTVGSLKSLLPKGNPTYTPGEGFQQNRPGHMGVDIGVDPNSPVTASQSGTVERISSIFGTWGEGVYIRYSDGHLGVYGHIESSVNVGDSVSKGDVIGRVKDWPKGYGGNTRYDQNSHLHYERINSDGININPQPYLNRIGPKTTGTQSNKPKGGRTKNILNTSNKGGNQSLFVYAVQPVETFVPFPYPVPIETTSSSPAPSKPRVPSGWRA